MLAEHPIDVMLTTTNFKATKQFYADQVGLDILIETDEFAAFQCGGDSRLVITQSNEHFRPQLR